MAVHPKITKFTRQEIDQFWKIAHRVLMHDGFTLLNAPAQQDFGRILIIIPKKIGNAPIRNKIRRQLKAIFLEKKIFQNQFDWAIIIKKPIRQLSFNELKNILNNVMRTE